MVVTIKAKTREDLNATVDPDDLRSLERRHVRVPSGTLLCKNLGGRTGFSVEATDWLLRHRNPVGIPVDTVSLELATRPRPTSTSALLALTATASTTSPVSSATERR